MKELQLTATYKPINLILQIEHTNGQLIEATLLCEAEVGGHRMRHDIWWKDMPADMRAMAQELIDAAIEEAITEDRVHYYEPVILPTPIDVTGED